MKWIELKDAKIGSGAIFLFGCEPGQPAYKVKSWLKQNKPQAIVLYSGPASKLREYQIAHWVKTCRQNEYHNYLTKGYCQNFFLSAVESFQSALQAFALKYGYAPAEVLVVRAYKVVR